MAFKASSLLVLLALVALARAHDAYDSYASPHNAKPDVKVPDVKVPNVEVDAHQHVKDYYKPHEGAHYYPKIDTTVIQGYVYCQNCYGHWTKHIVGGEVSVECKNEKGVVVAKGKDTTDETGFYQIKLPYDYKSKYGVDKCKAKLVKSSDYTCDVITNTGKGKEGAGVVFLKSYQNEAFFKTEPFAFSQVCHPHY